MATRKKPAKKTAPPALPEGWSRAPAPLPAGCSGDVATDAAGDVAALLDGDALDVGEPRWDEEFAKSLLPRERRAYEKASSAAYSAQSERLAWLASMARAAARTAPGRARLAELVRGAPPPALAVKQLAADALFQGASLAELAAIGEMLELPGDVQARRRGAKAILLSGKEQAFQKLSDRAADHAVLLALGEVGLSLDPRWLDPLLGLVGQGDPLTQLGAMTALARLDHEPRVVDALLRHLGEPAAAVTSIAQQALVLLSRSGDRRAVPYLVRALELRHGYWSLVLDGLRAAGEPSAVHAIRRWRDPHVASDPRWPGLAAADEVIAHLLTLGPVPPEAPALAAAPVERKPPVRHAVKKLVLPPAQTVAEQRADLIELLESADLARHADALIRPAIELFAQRVVESTLAVGASRLGGRPDLPRGMPWPKRGDDTFGFVGQLDLADLAPFDSEGLLPRTGLLSFFVMDELEGGYLEHARVVCFPGGSELVRAEVPATFDRRPPHTQLRQPYEACALTFRTLLELPSPSNAVVAQVLTEDERARYPDRTHGEHNQVLGWRDQGYDETPVDVALLLQITSDPQACMEWGDVETLCFMIPRSALITGDFTKVYPHIGD